MGDLLVVIPVRIADLRGEEIQCCVEVGSRPAADETFICHKSPEQVGMRTHQYVPIFYHFEQMVSFWGLLYAVHVLCFYIQDHLYVFSHSYTYLAFCAIIELHTKVVMPVASTDG